MTATWAIGMDGGGTKIAALCRSSDESSPLRRSESGPCNIAAMEPAAAAENAVKCVTQLNIAPDNVGAVVIGVAGYSAVQRRRRFTELLQATFPAAIVEVFSDFQIAHSGAFPDGVGVIVIAGTGSVAYGVNPIGESAIVGGYGYLIDDSGTGYGLGRQVLVGAGKTFDGIAGCDLLTALFIAKTGIRTREDLIAAIYGGSLDRASVASLAPLVTEAANGGDAYANSLLMHAGGALARLAQSTISGLFSQPESVQVAKIGSVWQAGHELNSVFESSLLRSCTSVRIVSPALTPVEGALLRAQKTLAGCS